VTTRFIDPGSIEERRAAWLDRGLIRRVREMPLQLLLQFRAQHCRMYHRGEYFDSGCWQCHLIERNVAKRMTKRTHAAGR